MDDLIDVIEGNRRYVKCLYVYNKVRLRKGVVTFDYRWKYSIFQKWLASIQLDSIL